MYGFGFLPTRIALGLTAAALVLASPASAQQTTTPRKGGTAIVAVGAEPTTLNSAISSNIPDVTVGCMVYEGLTRLNMVTDKPDPAMAESWTISPDGKTYVFKLRKTTWHDGQPFTSEDVRYSLLEVSSKVGPTFSAQAGKAIETINTPDPQTVEVKLKEPFGPLLSILTCAFSGGILPSHLFKGTDVRNNPASQRPVGTGPFKFVEWAHGDRITLVRNDKYWDAPKPYLDGITVKIMPSAGSRTQAMLAGEVDFIPYSYFPSSDIKTVASSPKLKREISGQAPGMMFLFFNLTRKPFDDVRVRHALLTATDRKYIFENIFYGEGKPGAAPWAKQIAWSADPSIDYDKSHPFDADKAGKMLEEAGYKADANGIRFKVVMTYDGAFSERNQIALALQAMWRRAGVEVVPTPLELSVMVPRVFREANFDVHMHSYASYSDPAIGVARAYITSTIGNTSGNASRYQNPEIDALFAKAGALTTLEERAAVYRQIQPILMRDLPVVMIHELRGYDAASRKLRDAWGYAGNGVWANAWLEP